MKKQFLPILALLGILFSSVSCTNDRHEIGGDISDEEIENPIPNPEPDKPTPEPDPDAKPNPDEGDNNKPTPEPDPDAKPNPDEGDNNNPTPNPEPEKPNPDEGDNNKPTPEPEPTQDFTFISLTPEYDRVTFDYSLSDNTIIQEIILLNTTNNTIDKTLFNGEKVFENIHRGVLYKIKFNYSIKSDNSVKSYYTESFSLKEPDLSVSFKSITTNKNSINYELELINEEYFVFDEIKVYLNNRDYVEAVRYTVKDVFENVKYFVDYSLRTEVKYHDKDTLKTGIKNCSSNIKTPKRELDDKEINIQWGASGVDYLIFDVFSEVRYDNSVFELYEVGSDEVIDSITGDLRKFTGLKPGHLYQVKCTTYLVDYNVTKSYVSCPLHTKIADGTDYFKFAKAEVVNNVINYKLDPEDYPAYKATNLNVLLFENGTRVDSRKTLQGTFSSLKDNTTYRVEVYYELECATENKISHSQKVELKTSAFNADAEFHFSPLYIHKDSISFDFNKGKLITIKNFELYEDDLFIQEIDANSRTFYYIPKANASYYVKVNYTIPNTLEVLSDTTNKEVVSFNNDTNVKFNFNNKTKCYSIELINCKNSTIEVKNVTINDSTSKVVYTGTSKTGEISGLVDNKVYFASYEFNVNTGNGTRIGDSTTIFKNEAEDQNLKLNTFLPLPNVLEYNIEAKAGINVTKVDLCLYGAISAGQVIQTNTTLNDHFDLVNPIKRYFIRVTYTETSNGQELTNEYEFSNYKYNFLNDYITINGTRTSTITYSTYLEKYAELKQLSQRITVYDATTRAKITETTLAQGTFEGLEAKHAYNLVLEYSYLKDSVIYNGKSAIRVNTKCDQNDEILLSNVRVANLNIYYDLFKGSYIKINKISLLKADKIIFETANTSNYFTLTTTGTYRILIEYENLRTKEVKTLNYDNIVLKSNNNNDVEIYNFIIKDDMVTFDWKFNDYYEGGWSFADMYLYDEYDNYLTNIRNSSKGVIIAELKSNTRYKIKIVANIDDLDWGTSFKEEMFISFTTQYENLLERLDSNA